MISKKVAGKIIAGKEEKTKIVKSVRSKMDKIAMITCKSCSKKTMRDKSECIHCGESINKD